MIQYSVNIHYDYIYSAVVTADNRYDAACKVRSLAEKAKRDELEYDGQTSCTITGKGPSVWKSLKELGWIIQGNDIDDTKTIILNDDPDDHIEAENIHACRDTIKENGLIAFVTTVDESESSRVFLSITDENKDSFCLYESEYELKDTMPSEIDDDYKSAVKAYLAGEVREPAIQELPIANLTAKQKCDEIECFIWGSKDCPQRIKDLWDSLKGHINY